MEHEFNEVQRFRIWWAWLGAAALNILFLYAIVQQLVLGKPFGEKPAPDFVLILIELLLLACCIFLFPSGCIQRSMRAAYTTAFILFIAANVLFPGTNYRKPICARTIPCWNMAAGVYG